MNIGALPIAAALLPAILSVRDVGTSAVGIAVVALFMALCGVSFRVQWQLLASFLCLGAILSLSFLVGATQSGVDVSVWRDLTHLARPAILYVIVAAFLADRSPERTLKWLVIGACAVSLIRILDYGYAISNAEDFRSLINHKFFVGFNFLPAVLLPWAIWTRNLNSFPGLRWGKWLMFTDFLISFSRTALVVLMISSLLPLLHPRFVQLRRGILVGAIIGAAVFVTIGFRSDYQFEQAYQAAVQEITETEFDTIEEIQRNWRAYELKRLSLKITGAPGIHGLIGFGAGSTIDLGIDQPLGKRVFTEISILHSGYGWLILKAGAIGLALYLLAVIFLGAIGRSCGAAVRLFGLIVVTNILVATIVVAGLFAVGAFGTIVLVYASLVSWDRNSRAAPAAKLVDF